MISPVLIDSRSQFKLAFWAAVFSLLVFAGGFVSGFQRASEQRLVSETLPLKLPPVAVSNNTGIVSAKEPVRLAPGAQIDVDLPDNAAGNMELEQGNPAVSVQTTRKNESLRVIVDKADRKQTRATVNAARSQIMQAETEDRENGNTATVAKQEPEKRYTIQAGTYSRLENAQIMLGQLQQQQLDAYLTDYRNRKNQIRYNVRFGAFASKKTAREQLAQYLGQAGRDAYIVKYNAKDIVDRVAVQENNATVQPQTLLPVQQEGAETETEPAQASPPQVPAQTGPAHPADRLSHIGLPVLPVVSASNEAHHTVN